MVRALLKSYKDWDTSLYLRESLLNSENSPNILGGLSADERALVLENATTRVYTPGEEVFSQGKRHDGIFLIDSGVIRTFYISPSGREITLAYWTRGNFVGGPEIFGGGEHVWSGVAFRESQIFFLQGVVLRSLVTKVPNLAVGIIECLVHKGRCYSELLQILGTRSVKARLAHLLVTLSSQYGVQTDDGILIERTYTHDEFANIIGSTRQWVTKMLEIYERRGFIQKKDRFIVIRDIDALQTSMV
jgi:CRP/FNR family cyclic AMP-dependent transcriptional regulator